MNTTILTLLRSDAKAWWWHKQLRRQDRAAEATVLERKSILSSVKNMRLTPEAHFHASKCVQFVWFREDKNSSRAVSLSGIHPGEWKAYHIRFGWDCLYHPDPYYKYPKLSHKHGWNNDDYCDVCGANGRA